MQVNNGVDFVSKIPRIFSEIIHLDVKAFEIWENIYRIKNIGNTK